MIEIILHSLGIVLGAYILLEAVDDAGRYAGMDRLCMVARDVSTGVAGLMLVWYSGEGRIDWLHIALALPLALNIWKKMVKRYYRFRGLSGGSV
jgi:hypothetical protein